MSLLSLSRMYSVPTYLVLGLAGAYLNLTRSDSEPVAPVDGRLLRRLAIGSVLFIAATDLFVRVMSV